MLTIGRKCLILPAIAILALVYAGFISVSSANENDGYQPAGAWAWTITSPMGSAPALVTLYQSGAVSVSTASMFSFPNPPGYSSPGHGVWEHTGPRSFGGITLYMLYDAYGDQIGFMRCRTALSFADDPDHIEGLMYIDYCIDCKDPLSEDTSWTPPIPICVSVSGTRIQRVDVPE